MKASELILKLNEMIEKHGDLPVHFSYTDNEEGTVSHWDVDALVHGIDGDGDPATSIVLMNKETYEDHLASC